MTVNLYEFGQRDEWEQECALRRGISRLIMDHEGCS